MSISIIQKSLKLRIYPNKNQQVILNKNFGCYRSVYNYHLAEWIDFYKNNITENQTKEERKEAWKAYKPLSYKEISNLESYEYLQEKDISTEALNQALRTCKSSLSNYFNSKSGKSKAKQAFPKFKSKKKHKDSFSLYMISDKCFDLENRNIQIPKIGKVKFSHEIKSKWINWYKEALPKHITLSRNACGEYYCSILFEGVWNFKDFEWDGDLIKTTGLDFSPKSLYINDLNEACKGYVPQKQAHQKQLTKLQRNLARKQKGSKNREKARIKLARLEKHIADSRKDFIEKETLRLVRTYDLIGIEDLNLKGISKFLPNAKNMVDTSWYTFTKRLQDKSLYYNCMVIKSDRYYPSSKTCNHCGFVNKNLALADRTWICPNCGETIIRDQNAALNLRENAVDQYLRLEQPEVTPEENLESFMLEDSLRQEARDALASRQFTRQSSQWPEYYKSYISTMPENYFNNLMDYISEAPEEDIVHSEYIFNDDKIIGVGFYKPESPRLTSVHKVIYLENPTYNCMETFFKKITKDKGAPHKITWKITGDNTLIEIGKEFCNIYNGYRELLSNNVSIHFVMES